MGRIRRLIMRHADKAAHFGVSLVLVPGTAQLLLVFGVGKFAALMFGTLASLSAGIVKEGCDELRYGGGSAGDIAADILGVAVGFVVGFLIF